MTAKYFCDVCGEEMLPDDYGRVKKKLGRIDVEIMTAVDRLWNGGHVCHRCVLDAAANGTNREVK